MLCTSRSRLSSHVARLTAARATLQPLSRRLAHAVEAHAYLHDDVSSAPPQQHVTPAVLGSRPLRILYKTPSVEFFPCRQARQLLKSPQGPLVNAPMLAVWLDSAVPYASPLAKTRE
jgi:hypothetical protein